jgi:hypothetical protein
VLAVFPSRGCWPLPEPFPVTGCFAPSQAEDVTAAAAAGYAFLWTKELLDAADMGKLLQRWD